MLFRSPLTSLLLRSTLLLSLLTAAPAAAQTTGPGRRQGRLSQLENAKIAYITEKIALTQAQAQQFWPLYNEFVAKRRDLNRQLRQLRPDNLDNLSDQQVRDQLNQALALRQQEVTLEKDYFNRFQKVLSIRQVGRLFIAERQFTKDVLRRVADGRGGTNSASGADD